MSSKPFNHGRGDLISYPVDVAGFRTRVLEAGSGERVMVCLHGTGSRADRFSPTVPGLVEAGYHVFAIDFPGHGLADKDEDLDYSARGFADKVVAVLDHLGLAGVILVGTSLGGHVASRVACDRPDLVSDLVLIGSTGLAPYPDEFKRPPESVAVATPDVVRSKLEFLVSDASSVTDSWVREESMINSSKGAYAALRRTAEFLNDGTNGDLQAERLNARTFAHPILLVWGENDGWTPPSMGKDALAALESARLVQVPGCGHAPYFEDPDRFVAEVAQHLGG